VVVDAEGSKKTNKTTLRSEWRGVRRKKKKAVERKKKRLYRASIVRDGRFGSPARFA
jgi:hypothetical protein